MTELKELCGKINMPEEVTSKILLQELDEKVLKESVNKLYHRISWEEALEEIRGVLGEDRNGFKILACMLTAGLHTYQCYSEKKISEKIFLDTFGCFSRFVREHMESFGVYGFDRWWWTPRQISMEEFRLGQLEFELEQWKGSTAISVHIPSDAIITEENCKASYEQAEQFFAEYFPRMEYQYFICDSWMLSPALKEILPPDSRILQFQKDYTVEEWDRDNPSYLEWVFKKSAALEELPEHTSLQRNMKQYLKEGGKIGTALGYRRSRPV